MTLFLMHLYLRELHLRGCGQPQPEPYILEYGSTPLGISQWIFQATSLVIVVEPM
jgi:hypothetical protein